MTQFHCNLCYLNKNGFKFRIHITNSQKRIHKNDVPKTNSAKLTKTISQTNSRNIIHKTNSQHEFTKTISQANSRKRTHNMNSLNEFTKRLHENEFTNEFTKRIHKTNSRKRIHTHEKKHVYYYI